MTDRQKCAVHIQTKGPHEPISLPWSSYARQPRTEITRPAFQHFSMHLMHDLLPNLIIFIILFLV
jgi:hypothetical protein